MISQSSSRQVQSVEQAFTIISLLQDLDGSTVGELTSELDLAKSTVHNYLGTLQSLGYVIERDGTYRLGLRFLTHGMAAKSGLQMREVVTHTLSEVSEELSYPVWWVVKELGRGIFVERTGPEEMPVYGRVGKRSHLHTHAPGKAILARCSPEEVERIVEYHGLPALTKETITDIDELDNELGLIREQGYAESDGEAALGIQSVGVAFEDPYGCAHGIGIFESSHKYSDTPKQNIPPALQKAADSICNSFSEGWE